MKKLVYALVISGISTAAIAQQQPATQPSEAQVQLERTIGNLVVSNITMSGQLQQAQAMIIDLQKQLAAAKARAATPTESKESPPPSK